MQRTDHLHRLVCWSQWYKHCYCKVLVESVSWCASKQILPKNLVESIRKNEDEEEGHHVARIKKGFQKLAHQAIKKIGAPDGAQRIRDEMQRWDGTAYGITGLPGLYSNLMVRRIQQVAKVAPPRVQAAVFMTMWNGWCTHRRFQNRSSRSNHCVFKCNDTSEDSLEHYCRCPVVLRAAKHIFHIDYSPGIALDLWTLNSYWLDVDDNLRGLALLIYGTYNAFNTIRHHGISNSDQAFHYIHQHCKLGCGGDTKCIRYIDSRWNAPVIHVC